MFHDVEVERRTPTSAAVIVGAAGLLAVAVVAGHGVAIVALLTLLVPTYVALRGVVVPWHAFVASLLLVVLFVPISFYELPASLPFDLELYRIIVAVVLLFWFFALVVDPSVRLSGTVFDRPLLFLVACVVASELANPGRIKLWGGHALKSVTFLLSFVLVYYLIATAIRRRESVVLLLRLLAAGAGAVAVAAIVERRTGFNVFWHLHSVFPFLIDANRGIGQSVSRGGNLRVFGSAEHPIALGAMFVMVIPVSIFLARSRGRHWWLVSAVLTLGALATGSRTSLAMLVAMAAVFLWLKPRETVSIWPLLVPALVVVHLVVPQAIGGLRAALFPPGGIVAEQSAGGGPNADSQLAGGRIRQLKPMLAEATRNPLFGQGYGTRISGFNQPNRNAPILDNQWLNIALDIGFVGLCLWMWLFVRTIRILARASRNPEEEGDDWLLTALAASIASFAVGMLTYDAFGFTQVFFVFWILLALCAAILNISYSPHERRPVPAASFPA